MTKYLISVLCILYIAPMPGFSSNLNSSTCSKSENNPPLSVFLNTVSSACTLNNGSINTNVSGGTLPITYLWSTGATTANIQNLSAGTYMVTVTDFTGSTASASAAVANQLNTTVAFTYAGKFPCAGQCNGSVFVMDSMINGMPPYSYSPSAGTMIPNSPGAGSTEFANLCDNTILNVTVTDALGCTGGQNIPIGGGPPVQNPSFVITPACNSLANGSVTISNLSWAAWNCDAMRIWLTDNCCNLCCFVSNAIQGVPLNLAAGNYLVETYCATALPGYECPQYFPFTIPDLGPTCSTVQGDAFVDLNGNCVKNVGDINLPNTVIEFTPGPWYAYTNSAGHYSTNIPWGNYNVVHYPPAGLVQLCPANPFPITLSSSNTNATINFADTSAIPFDIVAHISNGTARPGFDFMYAVKAQNNSYTPSGVITVTLNFDPMLSFVSANPAPFSTSSGQVVWQFNSITNFQSSVATVTLNVPANPALIGTSLSANVAMQAATTEPNTANNSATTTHTITGSFDPNVKHVQPFGAFLPAITNEIKYTIQFQNTGNDTAFTVELIDTLSSNLRVGTFVAGASSHPYTTEITGQGVLHFYFNNINLPDSTTDEARSHGFVSFTIKPKVNLPHNTSITNRSNIIFDFNPPINTNTTQSIVDLTLAINTTADTICQGQSVTLTMIPELTNTSWRWRAGTCNSTIISTSNSITITPTTTNTYFVRDSLGTIPVGSCYRKTIVVLPAPTTPFITQNFDTLFSSASSGNQWYLNGNVIAGAISPTYIPTQSGSYSVVTTAANGCTGSSAAYMFITTLTVDLIRNAGIKVFPNPTTSQLFVEIDEEHPSLKKIIVYDCIGNVVMERSGISENKFSIDLTEYIPGIYFLKIISINGVELTKVFKI